MLTHTPRQVSGYSLAEGRGFGIVAQRDDTKVFELPSFIAKDKAVDRSLGLPHRRVPSTHFVELQGVQMKIVALLPLALAGGIDATCCIVAAHFSQFGGLTWDTGIPKASRSA
jgi:hypothetical protein